MGVRRSQNKTTEAGETVLEFAAALPLFMLVVGGIVMFAWLFWAQAAADIASVRALKEGSINRAGDNINPGWGTAYFSQSTSNLTGARTSGVIGEAVFSEYFPERSVRANINGSAQMNFGPIASLFNFGGGGAGRIWRFWSGPPDPWE